ncbi:MAG: RNA methyltransferase [Holophagaceae bacterium]|nr:RNA methyltransferase [Holophagaceae bacterium]
MNLATDPRFAPYADLRAAGTRDLPGQGACFLCEGRTLVAEALAAAAEGRLRIVSVLASPAAALDFAERLPAGTELLIAEQEAIAAHAGFAFHRGVMAFVAVPPEASERKLMACARLLVLPQTRDAENLGLLIRSAAALGMDGVLAGPGPDLWNRRTVRVSMGALWKLPVWRREDPADRLAAWREAPDSEIVGAALGEGSMEARDWAPARRTALVLGEEGPGLDPAWRERCDRLVRIPMHRGVDSLNVAAAGAILMYLAGGRDAAG